MLKHLNLWLFRAFLVSTYVFTQFAFADFVYPEGEWRIVDYLILLISAGVWWYFHCFVSIIYEDAYSRNQSE